MVNYKNDIVLSLHLGLKTRQVDFSNVFMQSILKEDIYLEPQAGFEPEQEGSSQDTVLKLNKSLYGLVQSLLQWFNHLSEALEGMGFKASSYNPCMFYGKNMVILAYIDDCLFFGKSLKEIDAVIETLEKKGLALSKEENVYAFLGVQVKYDPNKNEYNMAQKELIDKVLKTCGMEQCNTKATPEAWMPLGTNADRRAF